jgi:hypothetical protein
VLNQNGIYVVTSAVGEEWRVDEERAQVGARRRDRELAMIAFAIVAQVVPFIVASALLSGCCMQQEPVPGKAAHYEAFLEGCMMHSQSMACYRRAEILGLGRSVCR